MIVICGFNSEFEVAHLALVPKNASMLVLVVKKPVLESGANDVIATLKALF